MPHPTDLSVLQLTPLELLIDLHLPNPRQGPGGDAQTEFALRLTGLDPAAPLNVADIGCGTGAATLALARQRSETAGVADRVTTLETSMGELPFAEAQFDLLWSEGAIYNMGFENGVKSWRRFLKPDGVLAVSELTWTTHARPPELQAHWVREYPEVGTASDKIRVLERSGYSPLGYFVLPESCWLANYYRPLQAGFGDFLDRHGYSETAQAVVAENEEEIALYEAHKAHFSYGVYVVTRLA
jgi:SAM-dependent methyltransferase